MIRSIVLLAALTVAPVLAQAEKPAGPFERGYRHHNDEPAVSCWIPKGLQRAKTKDEDPYYYGHAPTSLTLEFEVYSEDFETWTTSSESYSEVKTLDKRRVGGRSMQLIRYERKGDDEKKWTFVSGALDFGKVVFLVIVRLEDPTFVPHARAVVDWIADTLRGDGAAGLDPFLDPRRLDHDAGLWLRPAREFDERKQDDAVWAGTDKARSVRASVARSAAASVRAARAKARGAYARSRDRWRITEGKKKGRELLVSYHVDRHDPPNGIAIVVAEFGSHRFVVRVEGPNAERSYLTRTAEFIGWGLDYVDLAAARRDVEAASNSLVAAASKRKWAACRNAAETLAKHAYLEPARLTIRDHLVTVKDDDSRIAMLRGLTEHAGGTTDCAEALIKAARAYASRRNEPLLAAALGALGTVRSGKGTRLLIKYLQRSSPPVLIAALGSLARYRTERLRIVAAVVKSFLREEAAQKKRSVEALERWEAVAPVFRATLEALTEKRFGSSAEASAWWKANRRTLRN